MQNLLISIIFLILFIAPFIYYSKKKQKYTKKKKIHYLSRTAISQLVITFTYLSIMDMQILVLIFFVAAVTEILYIISKMIHKIINQ